MCVDRTYREIATWTSSSWSRGPWIRHKQLGASCWVWTDAHFVAQEYCTGEKTGDGGL